MLNWTLLSDLGAVLAVCAAAWILGRAWRSAVGLGAVRYRTVVDGPVDLALGLAALHALLLALDLIGVVWSLLSIGVAAACLALLTALARRWWHGLPAELEGGAVPAASPASGWGDAVALVVVGWLVLLCPTGVATTPDFIYQWGMKAHRFLIAGTIDWGFLASPLGIAPSPDYPNLVPDLFVLTSLLRGGFSEAAAALWAPVFVLLGCAGARATCAALGVSTVRSQAILAVTSLLMGMFTVGYRLAGGADLAIVAALLLALPALLRRSGSLDDLAVGAAVALAAGSKQEGVVLGVLLAAVYTLAHGRRLLTRPAARIGYLLRVGAMPLAVVFPWALQVLRYNLLGTTHPGGSVRWSALGEVLQAVVVSIQANEWHGLGWLVLLVPLLLVPTRTRLVGVVLSLQAVSYLIVYLRHPGEEITAYVLINAPRLVFHLVPATLVAALVYIGGGDRAGHVGERSRVHSPRFRRFAVWALLGVLGTWTGIAFVSEQWRALESLRSRYGSGVVARWRLGEERPESLRRFLADVDRATYPGSVLAFDPELEAADQRFFLTLWAAYFLPGKQVISGSHPDALREAQYLVTYNHHRAPPGAQRVVLHPSGSVYWLGEVAR